MRYLLTALLGILALGIFYSCQKEISVEYASSAKGSLQSSAGDCLPKSVAGSYVVNKSLNDSNFIEVSVNVTAPGPYKIYTDTVNGYAFLANGTFSSTGTNTVRLKGNGKPVAQGSDDFTVIFDSSYCFITVDVLPAGTSGGAAVFSLGGAPGNCTQFTPFGSYIKDTTLDTRHYVNVDVNVTTVGTYTISTNTVNGYSFSRTGTFGATGPQTIRLNGTGKPLAAGTNNFTVTASSTGSSTCAFSINVTATGSSSGCSPNVQGTFTAGTATTTANKVTLTHTYATAGTFNVITGTVNGYTFGTSSVVAAAGTPTTITLTATGTPTAAGTNNFNVDFGDGQSCAFPVTVVTGTPPPVTNTDYFPTTLNSWWTYDDGAGGTDTFKMMNIGPVNIGSTPFQRFVFSTAAGPFDTAFYRKDAATGFYYESIDTAGFGPDFIFTQPTLNLLFLKNTLTTGATWNSDFAATIIGFPGTLRFKYTCTDANATKVVNGKTFTNVYKIQLVIQAVLFGQPQDLAGPFDYYYAKGIGQILVDDGTNQQAVRYWVVN